MKARIDGVREDQPKEAGPRQAIGGASGKGRCRCLAEPRNGFGRELGDQVKTPHWVEADLGRGYGCKERGKDRID